MPLARHFTFLHTRGALLRVPGPAYTMPARGIGMVVARVLRGALKLRYLLLGGTIAGGSALAKASMGDSMVLFILLFYVCVCVCIYLIMVYRA